ncbi:alpha/beta hydrolase, partial [uncultured Desulfovibrio sp.]|uniref:alpha/beta hydrolase n=1 Tax=uncultured Desulfovibrio sp. TaxID=167968 RepID=UPI00261E995C
VGGEAGTLYFRAAAYAAAREPKELYSIPGASHVDLYDKPEFVQPVVRKLTDFFGQYLRG